MSETTQQSRQGWRRFGVTTVFVTVLMFGGCAGFDQWTDGRVEAEIARLEQRYGSLDEATRIVAPVPAADNRAHVVRAAAALTVPLPSSMYHLWTTGARARVPDELRAFVDANRAAIDRSNDIGVRNQSNWEVDYRLQHNLPPWEGIRTLSQVLYVSALLAIETGQLDAASKALSSSLAISASLRQEPDMINQLMRVNGHQLEAIQRLLSDEAPSGASLAELAYWTAENRTPNPRGEALLGEMKWANAMFARMERGQIDPNVASYIYPETWPRWPSKFLGVAARIGRPFVRLARARYLRQMGELLDVQAGVRPRPVTLERPDPKRWELVDRLVEKFTAGTGTFSVAGDDVVSELSATEIAIALRRFKLDHGAYPDDLSALTPSYLSSLPLDGNTGRPPIYARQGGGFTLHASGHTSSYVMPVLDWSVRN